MSRRPKKNPNQNLSPQNPYNPGAGWQHNYADRNNAWGNLGESFWGGHDPNFRQNRRGNEQWRPGDRGRNKPPGAEKSSSSVQEKYPWSTFKDKDSSENSLEASATSASGFSNDITSSDNNGEHEMDKYVYDKFVIFKESKKLIREQNRQLMMGLSKPVECSIAERMMQKMGWQGGGLGVKEEGRTEPVEVNLNFINKTTGLGHSVKKQKVQSEPQKQPKIPPALLKFANLSNKPIIPVLYLQPVTLDLNQKEPKPSEPKPIEKKKKKNKKEMQLINKIDKKKARKIKYETIDLDILETILDFVMDVKQIEYKFDVKYSKRERRIIHNFVEYLREGFNEEIVFDFDDSHLNKIDEINEYNNYVLMTQSQGVHPNRHLFMYKEAPDEVYLVTRDDLIEAQDDNTEEVIVDSDENNSDINKTETANKNTADNINKTPDLTKNVEPKVLKAASNVDLKEKSAKTTVIANEILMEIIENIPISNDSQSNDINLNNEKSAKNTIIAHEILTGIIENIPNSNDTQTNDNNLNKPVNDHLKNDKIKNKATVAVFIENCSKPLENDVETQVSNTNVINETNISENNLKTHEYLTNVTSQEMLEKIPKSKDASEIKNGEIIEIDLTDSDESPETELSTSQQNPKILDSNLETTEIQDETTEIQEETTEIQDETTEIDTENDIGNDMDVELEKIRGLPKLQHLESALYIYLKDFLKHDVYTEMRFLGDFGEEADEEQIYLSTILGSICEASARIKSYDEVCKLQKLYKELYNNETYCLQLGKDCNGGDVIYKILRNDEDCV